MENRPMMPVNPDADDEEARALAQLEASRERRKATQKESDRLIIKTMRLAVWGLYGLMIFFVLWLVSSIAIGMHDNRKIDGLERRVQALELQRR